MLALGGGGGGTVYATYHSASLEPSAPVVLPAVLRPGAVHVPSEGPGLWETAELRSISASGTSAWIVGSVAWRWDGSMWRNVALPSPRVFLRDVAAIASNNVWAIGSTVRRHRSGPLILHWDGAHWTGIPLPHLPGMTVTANSEFPAAQIRSIAAAGPHNVWALGTIYPRPRHSRPVLLHWDGHAWLRQPAPWARSGEVPGPIVPTGSSAVWFVNGHRIEYWNGARWRAVPPPFGPRDNIQASSATGESDAWAVGSYEDGNYRDGTSRPLAAHWDGSSWTVTPLPRLPGLGDAELDDVAAVRPGDVWAVGHGSTAQSYDDFVLHWDGTSWGVTPGAGLENVYWGEPSIAAGPDGSAWVMTSCGRENELLGWNGSSWAVVPHPRDVRWLPGVPAADRKSGLPSCR